LDAGEFGRYQLLGLIAEDGTGRVCRARDTETGQEVAVKVLPSDLADQPGYREWFRREARRWSQLTDPHLVPIVDSGEIDGRLFLVMPIIDGIDVASLLHRDGPMSPHRAVRVIEQLASALETAHWRGLVHGDVKPANALITETAGRDVVYLTGFGIARAMSPTGTADVYALACVLHECLTGIQPFAAYSMEQQIAGHVAGDPPLPSEQRWGVPTGFDHVIAQGLARDADRRYQSAQELADAAQRALTESLVPEPAVPEPPVPEPAPAEPSVLELAVPEPAEPPVPEPAPTEPPVTQPAFVDDTDEPGYAAPVEVPVEPEIPEQPLLYEGTNRLPATTDVPILPVAPPKSSRRGRTLAIAGAAAVVIVAVLAVVSYLVVWPALSKETASKTTALPTAAAPPRQVVLPFTLTDPDGVVVDKTGAVYVADSGNNQVLKLPAGSNTPTALPFTGLNKPAGLAVDNENSLYVVDQYNGRVLKLPAGSDAPVEIPFTGLGEPYDVAVDGSGGVYVVDFKKNRVLKQPAGSDTPIELPFTGLNGPFALALDDAGTVYVTDSGNNRVMKLAAGASAPVELPFTGLNYPASIAVDRGGNVYVTDLNNNRVLKLAAGSNTQSTVPFIALSFPYGLAVDSQGNVYVTTFRNRVVKLSPG
jgi:serine/threonine protein kinase, bacterial